MTSTNFKYIDRGKQNNIVLIPGWATDYRIFDSIELDFNYLVPMQFSPYTFNDALVSTLKDIKLDRISLFGWSLGGFAACDFAINYTRFIDELILVSIRKKYEKERIEEIIKLLRASKNGYLRKFYLDCFSIGSHIPDSIKELFKEYYRDMELDYLLQTMDYLSNAELKPELLQQLGKITIIHGKEDRIAPLSEAIEIHNTTDNTRLILMEKTGHMPFLEDNFSRLLN